MVCEDGFLISPELDWPHLHIWWWASQVKSWSGLELLSEAPMVLLHPPVIGANTCDIAYKAYRIFRNLSYKKFNPDCFKNSSDKHGFCGSKCIIQRSMFNALLARSIKSSKCTAFDQCIAITFPWFLPFF